jgi:hypothetical protein
VFRNASALAIKGISSPRGHGIAADLYLQHVVVVSDYLQVVDNLQGEYGGSYSMITNEIKHGCVCAIANEEFVGHMSRSEDPSATQG